MALDFSMNWRMTVIGGDDNGRDFVFAADERVTVGRSRNVRLRISKRTGDVSRHHVEFFLEEGVPFVRNISDNPLTKVNGRSLGPGEQTGVFRGGEVALGEVIRLRLDEVPATISKTSADQEIGEITDATRLSPMTAETSWQSGGLTDEPTAVLEEDPLAGEGQDSPSTASSGHGGFCTTSAVSQADFATRCDDVGDGETSSRVSNTVAPEDPETPMIDEAALQSLRDALARRQFWRRVTVGFSLAVVGLCLIALWIFSRNTKEVGETTVVDAPERFAVRDGSGKLLEVDYPAAPKRSVTPSPDDSGVTVISYQGRDRDVPFFLQLETITHPDELKIDLLASVRRWLERAAKSGEGMVFDEQLRDKLKVRFMEEAYPESCEKASLYGVRFVEFEYKRTWSDNRVWHGCAIYLRRGDSVYLLRRELPEEHWDRGGYRLKADPNLAVYANFALSYWESPGEELMPVDRKTSALMEEVRAALGKEMAADWRRVKRDIDALLARSWRTDPKTHDLAMSFLRQFRERMDRFYWKEYNKLQESKELAERDPKIARKMLRTRQDAKMIFDDPREWYYFQVRNPEVW